jgi:hypothetical protein
VKYLLLSLFLASGCAQPSSGNRTNSTNGTTGGNQDLAIAPGSDLAGVVTLPDLAGADLTGASGDLATVCDPIKQTGCPGSGLKCTLNPDTPDCVVNGTKDYGELCGSMQSDDCKASLLCIGLNATTPSCHQFCAAESDCKQPAPAGTPNGNVGHCLPVQNFSYSFCTVPCDPKNATTSCPSPLVCILGGNMMIADITNCEDKQANMTGVDNSDCTTDGCTPGFVCVNETIGMVMQKRCRKICTQTAGDCTISGHKCSINPGHIYGVCGPYT